MCKCQCGRGIPPRNPTVPCPHAHLLDDIKDDLGDLADWLRPGHLAIVPTPVHSVEAEVRGHQTGRHQGHVHVLEAR